MIKEKDGESLILRIDKEKMELDEKKMGEKIKEKIGGIEKKGKKEVEWIGKDEWYIWEGEGEEEDISKDLERIYEREKNSIVEVRKREKGIDI